MTRIRRPWAAGRAGLWRLAAAVLVAAVLASVGVLAVRLSSGGRPDVAAAAAHRFAPIAAAPRQARLTVVTATGTRACPRGAQPAVVVSNVYFTPRLAGGTTFEPRTYRITVQAKVKNETTAAIDVTRLTATVEGRAWTASTVAPTSVPANAAALVTFTGPYTSPVVQQARVATQLAWQWHNAALRPCGDRGLVEDN